METLSPTLLSVLACPQCKGKVDYNLKKQNLHCKKCKKTYPIQNGIPIMLP